MAEELAYYSPGLLELSSIGGCPWFGFTSNSRASCCPLYKVLGLMNPNLLGLLPGQFLSVALVARQGWRVEFEYGWQKMRGACRGRRNLNMTRKYYPSPWGTPDSTANSVNYDVLYISK